MIDAHIHIEKSPYTQDYLMSYINQAISLGLTEINLLEHTHRFKEWLPLYENVLKSNEKMKEWMDHKTLISIDEYHQFIKEFKKLDLPIKVNFGLEVCYFKDKEDFIKSQLDLFDYDFVIGSVHHVFNLAYDFDKISQEILWNKFPVNTIYQSYYEEVENLIKSNLFTQVGHIDTIKLFNIYPTYDLTDTYHHIAKLLNKHHVKAELNVGCYYRYGHQDLGLNDELLKILIKHQVDLVTSSDAHNPNDVGKYIKDATDKINFLKKTYEL